MSTADREAHGHKFVGDVRTTFLRELASTGHIYHACRVAGVSYQTMKLHRRGGKREDLEFEADYQQAMGDYVGVLKAEAQKRAVVGWDERPVIDKEGNVRGHVHKYSDTLLLALLKRSDDGYKERVQVDAKTEHGGEVTHTHSHGVDLEKVYKDMTTEEQDSWKVALRALARVGGLTEESEDTPPKETVH